MSRSSNPRRRTLLLLGVATLLAIALAIFALHREAGQGVSAYKPVSVLPGFAAHVREAAHIRIVSKQNTLDAAFVPEKGWVLPGRDNYPASFQTVQHTLVGLASLQTIAPKTGREDWLHFVGLDAPPRGDGMLITIRNDKGRILATLITGKTQSIGDPSGASGLFVRDPKSSQAYLARAYYTPSNTLTDWFDKTLLNVDEARVAQVDVDPPHGPSYSVQREKPADPNFVLDPMPKGRKLSYESAPDPVGSVLVGFDFADVQPARDLDFSDATRAVIRTYDGLVITLEGIQTGDDVWATVSAASIKPGTAKEAAAINAHASGWAYKMLPDTGQVIMTTRDSLLLPLPAAAKMGPAAH